MDEKMMNNCCEENSPLGEKCHLSFEDLLNDMERDFDIRDIYEYRNLLMIIQNELFLKEESSQTNRYKIYAILDKVSKMLAEEKETLPQVDINTFGQKTEYDIDDFYTTFCSNRLQCDEPFLVVNVPEHYTIVKGCS